MATYDFRCEECGEAFSRSMKMDDYDRKDTVCPECDSPKVKRVFTAPAIKTSKKS